MVVVCCDVSDGKQGRRETRTKTLPIGPSPVNMENGRRPDHLQPHQQHQQHQRHPHHALLGTRNDPNSGDLVDPAAAALASRAPRPDQLLPARLSRLEIVPAEAVASASVPVGVPVPLAVPAPAGVPCSEDNPFRRRGASRHQLPHPQHGPSRRLQHRQKQALRKMLLLRDRDRDRDREPGRAHQHHPADLSELVTDCSRLTISEEEGRPARALQAAGGSDPRQGQEPTSSSAPGSCSQQALNPPCDVTVAELASYFETMVYIPKKMSTMAEMMYI